MELRSIMDMTEEAPEFPCNTPSDGWYSAGSVEAQSKEVPIYALLQPWDTILEGGRAYLEKVGAILRRGKRHWGPGRSKNNCFCLTALRALTRNRDNNVQFDGRISHPGPLSGLMASVDIEETKKACKRLNRHLNWPPRGICPMTISSALVTPRRAL